MDQTTQQQPAIPRPQNETYAQATSGNGPIDAIPDVDELMFLTKFLEEFNL